MAVPRSMDRNLKYLAIVLLVLVAVVQADQTVFQPTTYVAGSSLTISSGVTATFAPGSTANFTGATVIGLETPLNFTNSLRRVGDNVDLDNDSDSPGSSMYYGTDSGGVKGYFPLSTGGGSTTFLGLSDTEDSYAGKAGQFTRVKNTEDGLEFSFVNIEQGVSGMGIGVANFLVGPSSANLRAALTDELSVGAGAKAIFSLGSLNVAATKTLSAGNSVTLTGTDGDT